MDSTALAHLALLSPEQHHNGVLIYFQLNEENQVSFFSSSEQEAQQAN